MTGFVHQALRYASDDQFRDAAAAFVRDGLDAGDSVLGVVSTRNFNLLAQALGSRFHSVECSDARDWYDYPSRTLGRYHAYCTRQAAPKSASSANRSGKAAPNSRPGNGCATNPSAANSPTSPAGRPTARTRPSSAPSATSTSRPACPP
ncbi:MAG: hypothetical protein HOY79_22785, partial [Streptomyces sp.]|nr:hypothetical protein [Streptomyces sp.]